jgi:hypothetical protein
MNNSVLMRNISQNITRLTPSHFDEDRKSHVAPAMLPSQVMWVSAPNSAGRLLLGREASLLQGFPISLNQDVVNSTAESLLQDLAGNMMALPVVLAISMALFASVSWETGSAEAAPASTDDDTEVALAAFNMVCKKARP